MKQLMVLVDGQFGSTGKGLVASKIASQNRHNQMAGVSTGGPNSGHTSYFGGKKIVLRHLPTFAVHRHLRGMETSAVIAPGAIVDPAVLIDEANQFPKLPVYVHEHAAVVREYDKEYEEKTVVNKISSTGKGTGKALASKVLRESRTAGFLSDWFKVKTDNIRVVNHEDYLEVIRKNYEVVVEVSQGFSLGINQGFYPYCTSRECTVAQGLSDACLPHIKDTLVVMTIRTFPIRVGNVGEGHSGGWYADQEELKWGEGPLQHIKPEVTTVTGRDRRIATYSSIQVQRAAFTNRPNIVCITHLDYLPEDKRAAFVERVHRDVREGIEGAHEIGVYGSTGPNTEDLVLLTGE